MGAAMAEQSAPTSATLPSVIDTRILVPLPSSVALSSVALSTPMLDSPVDAPPPLSKLPSSAKRVHQRMPSCAAQRAMNAPPANTTGAHMFGKAPGMSNDCDLLPLRSKRVAASCPDP